jgi:hypothetical protein
MLSHPVHLDFPAGTQRGTQRGTQPSAQSRTRSRAHLGDRIWVLAAERVRLREREKVMIDANVFKKSSFSGNGDCVEVAMTPTGVIVRDSKNPLGPVLWFSTMEWTAFIYGVLAGEFGLN